MSRPSSSPQPRPFHLRGDQGLVLAALLALAMAAAPQARAAVYHVDVAAGDDGRTAAEAQDPATPWQTITRAIGEPALAAGDTIEVAAGLYDAADDAGLPGSDVETFPLALVDGVAIVGAGAATTTISAPATQHVFWNQDTELASTTALSGFTLTHDVPGTVTLMKFTLESTAMAPRVHDNVFQGRGGPDEHGIRIEEEAGSARSFTGSIEESSFLDTTIGFWLEGSESGDADLSPTLRGNHFSANLVPILVSATGMFDGTVAPLVTGNEISGATGTGVMLELDVEGIPDGRLEFAPTVTDNSIAVTGGAGIEMRFAPSHEDGVVAIAARVVGNEIAAGGDGIFAELPLAGLDTDSLLETELTIADNTITGSGDDGVELALVEWRDGEAEIELSLVGNRVTDSADEGLLIDLRDASAVDDLRFLLTLVGNTVSGSGDDGLQLTVEGLDEFGHDAEADLIGNVFTGNGGDGMDLAGDSIDNASLSMRIQANVVSDNVDEGLTLTFLESSGAEELLALVSGNRAEGNGDRGMEFRLFDVATEPTATCNTISGNTGGGVLVDLDAVLASTTPDFGGGTGGETESTGENTIAGNTEGGGFDFQNLTGSSAPAEQNWWGSTDPPTIASHLDGAVDFEPFLTSPPALPTVGLTLVDTLLVDADGSGGPSAGDTLEYTATLTIGAGSCPVAGTFIAPIPAGATVVPGSVDTDGDVLGEEPVTILFPVETFSVLDPGGTETIRWQVVLGATCAASTQASFTGASATLSDDPDTLAAGDPTMTQLPIDLAITKQASAATAPAGTPISFTVEVTSDCAVSGATVDDVLPAALDGATWSCAATAGSSCAAAGAGDLDEVVDLAAGGVLTYTIEATIDPAFSGLLTNTATVAPPPGVPDTEPVDDSASAEVQVSPVPFVTGTKQVAGSFEEGGTVVYTITLTNDGTAALADDATEDELVDVLPPELILLSATATGGTPFADPPTNTVTWNGSLGPDASVVITIEATIATGTAGEPIGNLGTLNLDTDGDGASDAQRTTDDPSAPGPADPTVFVVAAASVVDIPALGPWGLTALVGMLLLVGLASLRRHSRPA